MSQVSIMESVPTTEKFSAPPDQDSAVVTDLGESMAYAEPWEDNDVLSAEVVAVAEAIPVKDSEAVYFAKMSEDGREPLAAVMSFMISGCTYRALAVVCRNDNYRKIAFALGRIFHTSDNIPTRVQIARGYDRLRNLVTTCINDLRQENRGSVHGLYGAYNQLIERLFTSHGYKAP